jgi:hypothetical protein
MKLRHGAVPAIGFVAGAALGAILWGAQMHRYRKDLFSASPVRRLAALGHLGGSRDTSVTGVLRDYVRWEHNPALRRRAERLLARFGRPRDSSLE